MPDDQRLNTHQEDKPARHGSAALGKSMPILHGLRVLDLSRVVAGPLAAQTLADLGADVIKVERRGEGDELRSLGPPWLASRAEQSEQSTYFVTVNRGKRSLSVDFSRPEGAKIVRELAATSDVFIENFRTGTLARYGLDQKTLSAINPRLIYCSITGFGQSGPYADRSGYDNLVQAMGGQMAVTGHGDGVPGGGPMRAGVPIADIAAGHYAVIGILAALLNRERTGRGQHIDLALFDAQVSLLLNHLSAWLNARTLLPRTGNDHPTAVPNGVFETADGHILIATFNDREFARLAEALGHPEWAQDTRFARARDRQAHKELLLSSINTVLKKAPRRHWMSLLNAAKISCGPINTMPDLETDPQLIERQMFVTLEHPALGPIRVAGSPLKFSETPVVYEAPPPLPGEHTDERLGLTDAQIAELRRAEVI